MKNIGLLFLLIMSHYYEEYDFENRSLIVKVLLSLTIPFVFIYLSFYALYLKIIDLWNSKK